MIVTKENFDEVLGLCGNCKYLSIDTETTGLVPYKDSEIFAVQIATEDREFYFNFWDYDVDDIDYNQLPKEYTLPRSYIPKFKHLLDLYYMTWFIHSAKFDMHMFNREGLQIVGTIWCTQAQARVLFNNHPRYKLGDCAFRIGKAKDDKVMEYIMKYHLWDWEEIPGREGKSSNKLLYFWLVPFSLMHPYGETDVRVGYDIGMDQVIKFKEMDAKRTGALPIAKVVENELELTGTIFHMERLGIKIDREYCAKALEHETTCYKQTALDWGKLTGLKYVDSAKGFKPAFEKLGIAAMKTDKDNDSYSAESLEKMPDNPLRSLILEYRKAYKKANTYYINFLYKASTNDIIHTSFNQAGAKTGRLSSSNPNLQNVNKEKDLTKEFLVRRAFIPRKGFIFFMLDYDQVEFKMLLNYANEEKIIKQVLGGMDVHEATANNMGVLRDTAKTINYMLLFGGGAGPLSKSLKIPPKEAKEIKVQYFEAMPRIRDIIWEINNKAKTRKFVFNWFGRRSWFPVSRESWLATNAVIQGGCGDVIKIAMNRCARYLEKKKSNMLLQIHDELLFEIHETEFSIVADLKKIMETAYPTPTGRLPLTCGIDHSFRSWADKVKGMP